MGFRTDKGNWDIEDMLLVSTAGRHSSGKIASNIEKSLAQSYFANADANRKSGFGRHGIKKGENPKGFILGGGMAMPRNVQSDKLAHEIGVLSSKISEASRIGRNRGREYTPPQYPIVTAATGMKMRSRDLARRNPIYSGGTKRFDSANPLFTDTNAFYNEGAAAPEWQAQATAVASPEDIERFKQEREAKKVKDARDAKAAGLRSDRKKRDMRDQNIAQKNFNYDMMDEFDQKMEDLTERYGGSKSKADMAFRKTLSKELPMFFKNSKFSTKQLFIMAKTMKAAGGLPFIGGLIKHPSTALPGLAIAAAMQNIKNLSMAAKVGAQATMAGVDPKILKSAGVVLEPLGGSSESMLKPVSNWNVNVGEMLRGGSTDFLEKFTKYGIDVAGSGEGGMMTSQEMLQRVATRIGELYFAGDQNQAQALATDANFDAAMFKLALQTYKGGKSFNSRLGVWKGVTGLAQNEWAEEAGQETGEGARAIWEIVKSIPTLLHKDIEDHPASLMFGGTGVLGAGMLGRLFDMAKENFPNVNMGAATGNTDSHNVQINQNNNINGGNPEDVVKAIKQAMEESAEVLETLGGKGR